MFSHGGGGCEAAVMPEAHCRKKKALSPLGGDDRGLLYFLGFTAAEAVAFARHGRDGEDFAAALRRKVVDDSLFFFGVVDSSSVVEEIFAAAAASFDGGVAEEILRETSLAFGESCMETAAAVFLHDEAPVLQDEMKIFEDKDAAVVGVLLMGHALQLDHGHGLGAEAPAAGTEVLRVLVLQKGAQISSDSFVIVAAQRVEDENAGLVLLFRDLLLRFSRRRVVAGRRRRRRSSRRGRRRRGREVRRRRD